MEGDGAAEQFVLQLDPTGQGHRAAHDHAA